MAKLQTADAMIGWNTLSPTFAETTRRSLSPYGLGGINRYVGGFYFSLFRAARAVRHQIQFRAPPSGRIAISRHRTEPIDRRRLRGVRKNQ